MFLNCFKLTQPAAKKQKDLPYQNAMRWQEYDTDFDTFDFWVIFDKMFVCEILV